MKKASKKGDTNASHRITNMIAEVGDWRGKVLARLRKAILDAAPELTEELKWGAAVSNGGKRTNSSRDSFLKISFCVAMLLSSYQTTAKRDPVLLRAHQRFHAELKSDDESFSEYRNGAVVSGRYDFRFIDSKALQESRYTPTLMKVRRDWKVAGYQTTRIAARADLPLQVRLGYPRDAKLLILNADDLAVSHSENIASFAALDQRFITSATVMVPCPWFTEVAAYAKAHHAIDLGLHLTLTSEWPTYRWGPVSPRALVPSLVGPDGYFYSSVPDFAKHAKLDEVEAEIRAQIERARSMGLDPSHLDAHMHSLYATPGLFRVMLKVAREYKLPVRLA